MVARDPQGRPGDCRAHRPGAPTRHQRPGPDEGRPLVDRIKGSRLHNLKELRPASTGGTEVRILFLFDPARQMLLLVAGDKSGNWQRWYDAAIPLAEARYAEHLAALSDESD